MELISKKEDMYENINTLQGYLNGSGAEHQFALDIIRSGICFVVTDNKGTSLFSPSRFVGYKNNTRQEHLNNGDKDGRKTNTSLNALLGEAPASNQGLEQMYEQFCLSIGVEIRKAPFGIQRKFWDIR